jgi:GGDEF domain-containing protein
VLVIAYMISLIVLITAIIAGYLVLRKEMVTQRALSEARTHINALHHSTNDSVSLMIDYRRATRQGNPNSRLAQVIEKRIKDATEVIDELGIMLRSTMLRLEGTTYWDKFEWIKTLVQDEPSTLLDRFTGQMHELVTRRDDLGVRAVRPLIPAEAAGARYGALSTNFKQASDQLAAMIDKHSIRLETVHKQLTTLIVFMLLLVSSLIVLPLWRRLIREHKRHEQAHKQLFEFAYIDQETGLPNLDGLELECLTKSVSLETGSEYYLLLIRIRNLDEIYNLIGSQQVLDLHKIISERLHTTSINLQSWSRSSESEYSTVISKQSVDCSELWMERLFVELINPVRVAGILVRPVINMAISQLRGVEYGRSGMLREHQANARMALPFSIVIPWIFLPMKYDSSRS